jgi:hypothetical protein
MTFNPMNIPPGGGPSLEPEPGKPWYSSRMMWIVVLAVVLGAIVYNL